MSKLIQTDPQYLIANIDIDSILQVVQGLLQVAGSSRSQVAGVHIRLWGDRERGTGWFCHLGAKPTGEASADP